MAKGKHPNSLKNLKPFVKGVSGNPGGRPVAFSKLAAELKELGSEDVWHEWNNANLGTRRELVLQAIWDKAQDGSFQAIELLEKLGCLD